MKRRHNWLLYVGLGLMLAGLVLVLGSALVRHLWQTQASRLAGQIEALLPDRSVGVPEDYSSMDMPALSLDGQDFIGLVEVPAYGIQLPLCSHWRPGSVGKYPCRFDGTLYNDSLIIGAGGAQFSCAKTMGHGDVVKVTDLQGAVYTYRVTNICRSDHADAATLRRDDARLVLFVRDRFTLEYIVISCA